MKAPATVKLLVCPVCGRSDRMQPFTGKSHWHHGSKCPGQPEPVIYGRSELGLLPDFGKCANCGADAMTYASWDPALGWCCSSCGGSDGDE